MDGNSLKAQKFFMPKHSSFTTRFVSSASAKAKR